MKEREGESVGEREREREKARQKYEDRGGLDGRLLSRLTCDTG